VFDAHSQELLEVWEAIYRPGAGANWKASVERKFEPSNCDLLYLADIRIDKDHQGRGLGLLVIDQIIRLYSPGCGLVVIRPFPTDAHDDDGNLRYSRAKLSEMCKKLRLYYSKIGFKPIGHGEFMGRSTTFRQPDIREVLGTFPLIEPAVAV
jgi:hypothetical protein